MQTRSNSVIQRRVKRQDLVDGAFIKQRTLRPNIDVERCRSVQQKTTLQMTRPIDLRYGDPFASVASAVVRPAAYLAGQWIQH